MRRLMWLALGFALSCGLGAWHLLDGQLWLLGLGTGITAGFLRILAGKRNLFFRPAIFLLGVAVGLLWYWGYDSLLLREPAELDGKEIMAVIRAESYGYDTGYGTAFDGQIEQKGRSYQTRVYLNEEREVSPGDVFLGKFRFRTTLPGGSEESTYHKGRGIFLLAYQRGDLTRWREKTDWQGQISCLREEILELLDRAFPEDTASFAKALLLGDTTGLDYETDTDLKISGIRHVIAVSGQHVSILFALLTLLTFRKRFLTALVGLPVLALFSALAGFSPSVVRACLMWGLMLLAQLLDRDYDNPTGLSFAVLTMLLINPLVITDVGFQLSVASVAGIYLFFQPLRTWLLDRFPKASGRGAGRRLASWFSASVAVTLSALVMTAPISALHFGTVSLIGAVTNLLTMWIIGPLFYGILAVCLLGCFLPAAAGGLGWLLSWGIRYVLVVAKTMGDFPLAAVYTCSEYIVLWLIFVYLLLGVFLIAKPRQPVVLSCCAVIGLCAALLASWAEPGRDDVRFTVLDVGQGQCLLVQTEGKTIMVDCGGDDDGETADIAAETLLSQGITKLDGLILTHLDRDHAGAAENLLTRIDADFAVLPAKRHTMEFPKETEVLYVSREMELEFSGTVIRIYPANFPGNSNENSLCILFDTEKCDILVTGDRNGFGERTLLRYAHIPKVDILVAGHHGSAGSTCEELLEAVRPEVVCISVARDNPYGHPAVKLLERLQKYGCAVYRTDRDGTILIRR